MKNMKNMKSRITAAIAALILLVLLYQYLAMQGVDVPVLRLLATNDSRLITVETAFSAYMIAFSVRTGKGI